jgi:hypothetical protein
MTRKKTGGRQKGSLNKTTIERRMRALKVLTGHIEMPDQGSELAVDVLNRMMRLAEGAASVFRPVTTQEQAAGKAPNPEGDWQKFGEWYDRTVAAARSLASYQSPTLRAIQIAPPPLVSEGDARKVITLRVFDGGRLTEPLKGAEDQDQQTKAS